jgi:hypothetical protein
MARASTFISRGGISLFSVFNVPHWLSDRMLLKRAFNLFRGRRMVHWLKMIFFVLILIADISAAWADAKFAEVPNLLRQTLTKLSCRKNIEQTIPSPLTNKEWVPFLVSEPNQKLKTGIIYRNSKTGFSYSLYGDSEASTYTVLNKKTNEYVKTTWPAKACDQSTVVKMKTTSSINLSKKSDGTFSDLDLQNTLQKTGWGVIYVWTPYMPLSVEGLAEIKKAVTAEKGTLTILMDRNASLDQAEKWVSQGLVQKQELKKVEAAELFDRGLGVHYPVAYLYENGFLSNSEFVGYKKASMYSKWIQIQKRKIQKDLQ